MNSPNLTTIPDRVERLQLGLAIGLLIQALRSGASPAAGACIIDHPDANQATRTTVAGSHHYVDRALRAWAAMRMTPATIAYAARISERLRVNQPPERVVVVCISSWGTVDRAWMCSLMPAAELGALEPITSSVAFAPVPIGSLN